jgi:hypothetical protein
MSQLHVPFRVLREAVRIIFVLKIGSGVASGFDRVREDSDALEGLPAVLFRMGAGKQADFGGDSARNRGLLSRSCNSVQW